MTKKHRGTAARDVPAEVQRLEPPTRAPRTARRRRACASASPRPAKSPRRRAKAARRVCAPFSTAPQLSSRSVSASAAEAAAGRLGRRTGMPAALAAVKPASAAASGRQRSHSCWCGACGGSRCAGKNDDFGRGISRHAVVCSSSSSWRPAFGLKLLTRPWALGNGPVCLVLRERRSPFRNSRIFGHHSAANAPFATPRECAREKPNHEAEPKPAGPQNNTQAH